MRSQPCLFKKAVDFRAKIKSVIIINNYIYGNLWIKRVGGREMLKASGENVKCLEKGEKS